MAMETDKAMGRIVLGPFLDGTWGSASALLAVWIEH